jgi:hypothetical protein
MNVEVSRSRKHRDSLGPPCMTLDPELPPDDVRRVEVDLTYKERPDWRGRDRLDNLEPLDVGPPRVPWVTAIAGNSTPQETACFIGHEQQRAFRSVASPLSAENDNVLGGKLQVRWNLHRPGARVLPGWKRRDLDHSARFQSVDVEAGIGSRQG